MEVVNVIRRDFIWYDFLAISSLLGWGLYLTAVVFIVFIERKWYVGNTSTQYVCQMKIHSQQLYSPRVFNKETIFWGTHFLIVMSRIPLRFFISVIS